MNIIKRLTAVTSLTVCIGILTPTTIVFAKTSSTNDSHIEKSKDSMNTIGFAEMLPASQNNQIDINRKLGNSLLQEGDVNDFVAALQYELQELGYYTGAIDGSFNELTAIAVKNFQLSQDIEDSGVVGPDTKTVLYSLYRHSTEAKMNQDRATELKEQAEQAAREKAKRIAEEKAEKEAAEKAAKEKAEREAERKAKEQAAEEAAREKQQAKARSHQSHKVKKTAYKPKKAASNNQSQETMTVEATSYALGGITATGVNLTSNPNAKVVAVDPNVIPLGTKILIPGYGVYTAADTGGAIKGHRIDVHLPTKEAAKQFGRRTIKIKILK